jgi:hypothetical protein
MASALNAILQHPAIWHGNALAQVDMPSAPTGFAELDALLPGGGWPKGALCEILLAQRGIGELSLAVPALGRLSDADLYLALIAPPYVPYAPGLAAAGIKLSKLTIVLAQTPQDTLWATEQCLRSQACAAVLAWVGTADERALRRLQLAAQAGKSWGLLYRPLRCAATASPAALRMALAPAKDGVSVNILKRRGGPTSKPIHLRLHREPRQTLSAVARTQMPSRNASRFHAEAVKEENGATRPLSRLFGTTKWNSEDPRYR